jgi:hypothetical protein
MRSPSRRRQLLQKSILESIAVCPADLFEVVVAATVKPVVELVECIEDRAEAEDRMDCGSVEDQLHQLQCLLRIIMGRPKLSQNNEKGLLRADSQPLSQIPLEKPDMIESVCLVQHPGERDWNSGDRRGGCILGRDILDTYLQSMMADASSCPIKLTV